MLKPKTSHSCSLYKNLSCLTLGLLIGIRFTSFWYNLQNYNASKLPEMSATSETESLAVPSPLSPLSLMEAELWPQYLFNTTRVLCWITTYPSNHLSKAIHIRHTWGKRCNKLLFMSTEEDDALPSIKLNVAEGRDNLWNKTKQALKYIYDHHFDEAEWFLKADDDTYVIMENLRYLLYQYSPETPIHFGAKFKKYIKQGYMSGGASYVLSKESLKKFVLEAYDNSSTCPKYFQSEDVQLGFCLENIGVMAGDSRDEEGNERFLPLALEHLIPMDTSGWYKNYVYYPPKEDGNCCSANAISFHYIKPRQFYILEYFIYTLKLFGFLEKSVYSLPTNLNNPEDVTHSV